jgi:hypothetical protein
MPVLSRDTACEGPAGRSTEHYAIWWHLIAILQHGKQSGVVGEFGKVAFGHARADSSYGALFNAAMTSYSAITSEMALASLASEDLSSSFRQSCEGA